MTDQENSIYAALDPVLHQPIRTRIAAFLSARGEATFGELKQALKLTDGNLEAHMKKLTQSGYVHASKEKHGKRPLTFYSLSESGKEALASYVSALSGLLNID
ncbi:MAG: transcriptional regulator [Mariprofundaceae bacterium]|nr:transcriptional regulator [Mariprofundaceae bacterium]